MKKVHGIKLWIVSMIVMILFLGCPPKVDSPQQKPSNLQDDSLTQKKNSKNATFTFKNKEEKVQFPEIYGGKAVFVQRLTLSPGIGDAIPIKISVKASYVPYGVTSEITIDGSRDAVIYDANAPLKFGGLIPGVFNITASKAGTNRNDSVEEASYLLIVDAGSMQDTFFGPIQLEKKYNPDPTANFFSRDHVKKEFWKKSPDLSELDYNLDTDNFNAKAINDDGNLAVEWKSQDLRFDIKKVGKSIYNAELTLASGLKKYTILIFRVTAADGGGLSVGSFPSEVYDPSGEFTSEKIKAAVTGEFTTKPGFKIENAQKLSSKNEQGHSISVLEWNEGAKSLKIKNVGTATYKVTFMATNYESKSVHIQFNVTRAPMGELLQLDDSHMERYVKDRSYTEDELLAMIDGEPVGATISRLEIESGTSLKVLNEIKLVHVEYGKSQVKVRLEHPNYEEKDMSLKFHIVAQIGEQPENVRLDVYSAQWGTAVQIQEYDVAAYEYKVMPPKAYDDLALGKIKLDSPGRVSIQRKLKATKMRGDSPYSEAVFVEFTKREQGDLVIVNPIQKPWTRSVQLSLETGKGGSGGGQLTYSIVPQGTTARNAKVTSHGEVTVGGSGTVGVQVTKAADEKYQEKVSGTVTVNFDKLNMNIKVAQDRVIVNYSGRTYNENDILNMFIKGEPTGTSIKQIKPYITKKYSPTAIVMAGTTLREVFDVKNPLSIYIIVLSHPDYHDTEVSIFIDMKFFMSSSGLQKRTDKDVFYTGRGYDKEDMLELFVEGEPQGTKITNIRKISGTGIKMATKTIFLQVSAGGGVNLFEFTLSHPDYRDETVEAGITVKHGTMQVSQEPTSRIVKYTGSTYDEQDILKLFIAGEPRGTKIKNIESITTYFSNIEVVNGTSLREKYAGFDDNEFKITLSDSNYNDAEVFVNIKVDFATMSVVTGDTSITYDPANPSYTYQDILINNIEGEPVRTSIRFDDDKINSKVKAAIITDDDPVSQELDLRMLVGDTYTISVILLAPNFRLKKVSFKLTVNKYTPPKPPRPKFFTDSSYTKISDNSSISTQGNSVVIAAGKTGYRESDGYEYEITKLGTGARYVSKKTWSNGNINIYAYAENYPRWRENFSATVKVRLRSKATKTMKTSPWSDTLTIKFLPLRTGTGGSGTDNENNLSKGGGP